MTNNCELSDIPRTESSAPPTATVDHQELRELYEQQQRRLSCPSCGEEPFID